MLNLILIENDLRQICICFSIFRTCTCRSKTPTLCVSNLISVSFRLLFLFAFRVSLTTATKFIKLAKSTAAIKSPLFLTNYSRDRHEITFVHHGEKIPRNRHTTTMRGNLNRLIPSECVLNHNPGEKRAYSSTVDDLFHTTPRLLQSEARPEIFTVLFKYYRESSPRIHTYHAYIWCVSLPNWSPRNPAHATPTTSV